MRPEEENRLNRQLNLGVDKGMRLVLRWESGFTVTVHSWEAAAVITKQRLQNTKNPLRKASSFRQNFYAGDYADGIQCVNPSSMRTEPCFIEMTHQAKRGAAVDPVVQARKLEELKAKAAKLANKLIEVNNEIERLDE